MKRTCAAALAVLLLLAQPFALAGSDAPEVSAGDVVAFGSYEQDNDPANGPEPIEWIVLETADGKALLLSRYALDVRPYHPEAADVTWESCALRSWLNGDFLQTAFNGTERQAILLTEVDNSDAQGSGEYDDVTGGSATSDLVFLLSCHEACDLYFPNEEDRICAATEYALAKGAWTTETDLAEGRPATAWWLRSPGCLQEDALSVFSDGDLDDSGVYSGGTAVRPALWLNLESGLF